MVEAMRKAGHEVVELGSTQSSAADGAGWDLHAAGPEAQAGDAAQVRAALAGRRFNWVVVDHYQLGAPWEEAIRPIAAAVMTIDDLANRAHACDLLLDQTAGRTAGEYRPLVPGHCTLLMGASFSLLRPGFAAMRTASLRRRRQPAPVARILVFLGGTDVGGLTEAVVRGLLDRLPGVDIHVVIGGAAKTKHALERLAGEQDRVHLHVDTPDMPSLIANADLAVGAAGSASWERCCLGLPAILLVLADNQRLVADNLEAIGASITAYSPAQAVELAARLAGSEQQLQSMIAAAAGVTDGAGTERVADALLGQSSDPAATAPLTVRPAADTDSLALWLWRNDPVTRATSKTSEPVPWQQHARWFAACLASPDRWLLMGEVGAEPVGMVRFDRREDGSHLVSINVAPAWRGRKIGAALLGKAHEALQGRFGSARCVAEIHDANTASQRIFARCGFERVGGAEDGWGRYERPGDLG
jgi:UDP-2,4-diacetamido-2,4,6-trideoxy-beta-L-altropyranose hydrolase